VQKFLTPHWRNVVPFALSSPDEFLPPGPQDISLLLLDKEVDGPTSTLRLFLRSGLRRTSPETPS
jgi:hypothetical protein